MYIPDNYDKWRERDREEQAELEKLPVCDYCDEPIMDEHYYEINGDIICQECLDSNFRKAVDVA